MTIFKNTQWEVTDWGLTSIKPSAPYEYEIAASRLLETANFGGKKYNWPRQIAEKTWADLKAFLEAYAQAIEFHKGKYKGTVDLKLMQESIAMAWNEYEPRRR